MNEPGFRATPHLYRNVAELQIVTIEVGDFRSNCLATISYEPQINVGAALYAARTSVACDNLMGERER